MTLVVTILVEYAEKVLVGLAQRDVFFLLLLIEVQ